ncbi:DNA polymerase III subunit epsilon [bacterium]|nr:DNA polymerase III subunit epsilon [bacterium]
MSESLREIVFDTETTGFNYSGDDRIVEIGCVEMLNHTPTGKTFHCYINPEREVPEEVVRVHGLTTEFLSDKPKFSEIAQDFVDFIGDANMVAHNAVFDMNFINAEFKRIGMPEVSFDRMVDTLAISRKKNPHLAKHNLDSLCNRYGIDNSHRELHGALLDARLLAEVYIELLGGKEVDFFKTSNEEMEITASTTNNVKKKPFRPSRNFPIPEADLKNHNEFIASLGDNLVWNKEESTNP